MLQVSEKYDLDDRPQTNGASDSFANGKVSNRFYHLYSYLNERHMDNPLVMMKANYFSMTNVARART